MKNNDRDDRWEDWVRQALPGAHLRQPPASTLRKALALGSRLQPRATLSGWLIELLFDSAGQPLPAGVRGTTAGQRRLLYRARTEAGEEMQLDLRLRRESGDALELTGQLLPPWTGARVQAVAGRTRRKQTLGDAGEFLVKRMPAKAGTLRIEIRAANGDEIVIPDIPLPDPTSEPS